MRAARIRFTAIAMLFALVSHASVAISDGAWDLTNEQAGNGFAGWAGSSRTRILKGDFDGNGLTDFALIRRGWRTIPVAFAYGTGQWVVTNNPAGNGWTPDSSSTVVAGDFNGDGRTDLALVRPGWSRMPVAFFNKYGGWDVTNKAASNGMWSSWARWIATSRVKFLDGDFNGDGLTDIALLRDGWSTIPIAFSDGIGGWDVTNEPAGKFVGWATFRLYRDELKSGQKLINRDFNGDGRTDIAAVRPGWRTIPIAFSNGAGGWDITNKPVGNGWVPNTSTSFVAGDFDGNGRSDIAMVRPGLSTLPVVFSDGIGGWRTTSKPTRNGWSPDRSTNARVGDFDADGRDDIVLVRSGWSTMPIAFSNRIGGWDFINREVGNGWAGWVGASGVKVVTGSFDDNGRTDVALVRNRSGWSTIPIAFSRKASYILPPLWSMTTKAPSKSDSIDQR